MSIVNYQLSILRSALALSVVGVGAMLAHVVLLDEERVHGKSGIHREGDESHLGALLHDLGVVHGIVG